MRGVFTSGFVHLRQLPGNRQRVLLRRGRRVSPKLMKNLIIALLLAGVLHAQLPNAPAPQPAPKCGPWSCWSNLEPMPWHDVVRNKTMWTAIGIDQAAVWYDISMSRTHQSHACQEGNPHLPAYPTVGQLFLIDLPEQAAVGILEVGFTKLRMPKWLRLGIVAIPLGVHGYAGSTWIGC